MGVQPSLSLLKWVCKPLSSKLALILSDAYSGVTHKFFLSNFIDSFRWGKWKLLILFCRGLAAINTAVNASMACLFAKVAVTRHCSPH